MLRRLIGFMLGWLVLTGMAQIGHAVEAAGGRSAPERRVALVIGNGAYRNSPVLKNPVSDGRAMTRLLTQLGFEVVSGINLDRAAMEDLIDRFTEKMENADVALAFYAGHGIQVDGRNYLLRVHAKPECRNGVRRRLDAQVLVD